jgi:hypothetical protein
VHARHRAIVLIVGLIMAEMTLKEASASPGLLRNRGEFPPEVLCYGRVGGATAFITTDGIVLALQSRVGDAEATNEAAPRTPSVRHLARQAIRIRLTDEASPAAVTPLDSLPFVVNRYRGRMPAQWHVGEHPWTSVQLSGSGSTAGAIVRVDGDSLVIEPASDLDPRVERLKLGIEGATSTAMMASGGLSIQTSLGPVMAQPHGKRGWCLVRDSHGSEGEQPDMGGQAKSRAEVLWSTYLGGSDYDAPRAMALDGDENPVVFGQAYSLDFPVTPGAYDTTNVASDGFLARFDGRTGRPHWVTYLGGSQTNELFGLAISSQQQAVVAGWTESPDYPTTPGAYDETLDAYWAAVITSMDLDSGQLVWSTFLERCYGWSIALTSDDCPVIAGSTTSADFVTTPGAFDQDLNGPSGVQDGTISKLSADGSSLLWSTYLGSHISESNNAITIDGQNRPVVSGIIYALPGETAEDFPVTPGSYDVTFNGDRDYYVAVLESDGSDLAWCTFLGGSSLDIPSGVSLDHAGNVVVIGNTTSEDFPVTNGAFEWTPDSSPCAVTIISGNGQDLLASRVFGGVGTTFGTTVFTQPNGSFLMSGCTYGPTFPVGEPVAPEPVLGLSDAFVVEMDSSLTRMKWFTLLGGQNLESYNRVVRSADGRLFMSGMTGDFPLTPGAYDTTQVLEEVYIVCLAGPVVPVTLAAFMASWENGQVVVHWQIVEEPGVTGVGLYRQVGKEERVLVREVALTGQCRYDVIDTGCRANDHVQYWLREVGAPGAAGWYGPAELEPMGSVESLTLNPARPNPFNPHATIRYSLPKSGRASLAIYDVRGARVATLVDADLPAGEQSVEWAGVSDDGTPMPSGVYFARLETAAGVRTVKVTLAK